MSATRAELIQQARDLIDSKSTDVPVLRDVAFQLYRRSDSMPLTHHVAIQTHGLLRDLADRLTARADALSEADAR